MPDTLITLAALRGAEVLKRIVSRGLDPNTFNEYLDAVENVYRSTVRWLRIRDDLSSRIDGMTLGELASRDKEALVLLVGGYGKPRGAYLLSRLLFKIKGLDDEIRRLLESSNDITKSAFTLNAESADFTKEVENLALSAGRLLQAAGRSPREAEKGVEYSTEPQAVLEALARLIADAIKVLPVSHPSPAAIQALRAISPRWASEWLGLKMPGDDRLRDMGIEPEAAIENSKKPEYSVYTVTRDKLAALVDEVSCHAYSLLSLIRNEHSRLLLNKDTIIIEFSYIVDQLPANLKQAITNLIDTLKLSSNSISQPFSCVVHGVASIYYGLFSYQVAKAGVSFIDGDAVVGDVIVDSLEFTQVVSAASVAGLAAVVGPHVPIVMIAYK